MTQRAAWSLAVVGALATMAASCEPREVPALTLDDIADGIASPRTLFIGAHPDDEQIFSPLLGEACVDEGWECTFLVATRGEGGPCELADGCQPDLGTVRAQEMIAASELFHGDVVQWTLENGGSHLPSAGDVEGRLTTWAAAVGGIETLLEDLGQAIGEVAPDVVFTFDPRHGSSCHPEHRAIASAALTALKAQDDVSARVFLAAGAWSGLDPLRGAGFVPAVGSDEAVQAYDATVRLDSIDGEAWEYYLEDRRIHASQHNTTPDDPYFSGLVHADDAMKRVYAVELEDADPDDILYEGYCSPSTFQ